MLKNSSVVQYNLYQEANPQYLALRTVLLIFWFVSSTKRNMRNVFLCAQNATSQAKLIAVVSWCW